VGATSRAQALALRGRMVLAAARGLKNTEIVAESGIGRPMVTEWRNWFVEHRLEA
jgi:hypothetical protein